MNPDRLFTIAISALLSIVGWVVGYTTTIRRDRIAKRRDLRTQYLLEAYRQLEGASNRVQPSDDDEKALERAADIQLLGSPEQVRLAREFAFEFARSGHASLDHLLETLRRDLRTELSLPRLDTAGTHHLRIVRNQQSRSVDREKL